MVNLYFVGENRIFYKAASFAIGKTVTAYLWNPSMVKSALQTFTEIGEGLYYLDYNFVVEGNYVGKFYENGVAIISQIFRVNTISTQVASILDDTGTNGVVVKATGLSADAVDEILDEVVEGTITLRQAMRLLLAGMAGKSTGGGTATLTFWDIADSKARITATVDADGNRTAVTRDGT